MLTFCRSKTRLGATKGLGLYWAYGLKGLGLGFRVRV